MNKLLEDEDSADEEFWNQDAFAEEEDDGQYESESEQEDVFDDDFDDDESSSDSEEVVVARERRKPALKAPERKAPAAPREKNPAAPRAPRGLDSSLAESFQGDASTWDGGLRKSSRSGVKEILARSEAAREAAKSRPAPKRNPNAEPPRQLTQAEILAEAAVTEVANLRDLERLLNIEEAVKKKAERVKKVYAGPSVRVRSKKVDGVERTTLETRMGAKLPAPLGAPRPETPETARCAITGDVARYRDPRTGLPYRDAAAFAEIRRRERAGADGSEGDDEGDDRVVDAMDDAEQGPGPEASGPGPGSGPGPVRENAAGVFGTAATTTPTATLPSFVSAASGAAAAAAAASAAATHFPGAAIAGGFPGVAVGGAVGVAVGAPAGGRGQGRGRGSGRGRGRPPGPASRDAKKAKKLVSLNDL